MDLGEENIEIEDIIGIMGEFEFDFVVLMWNFFDIILLGLCKKMIVFRRYVFKCLGVKCYVICNLFLSSLRIKI